MRPILLAVGLLALPAEAGAAEASAIESLARVRPDVDLALGFERCGAPPELYTRLQDELLFAVGAETLAPEAAALAGVEPGHGIEGLLVAARGAQRLAIVPTNARPAAVGDEALLRGGATPAAAPLEPPPGAEAPGRRCAWLVARPAWVGADGPAAAEAGWSVLTSLAGVRSMTVTANFSTEVELVLHVVAADPRDAQVLADGLGQFLASRRANSGAPPAVRSAVERAAVERRAEAVTLRLPLSLEALLRIRRNADSRTLLRLRLEDGERERWQKVADVVRALDVHPGDSVVDVGAGDGFFTLRLAEVVGGSGRALAVEIGEKAVAALSRRAAASGFDNVEPLLGAPDDPRLPKAALDAALIVNAYHEMSLHEAMLTRLFEALKPGGRLVLVEPWSPRRRGEPRADQVKDHILAPELAEEELRQAGFVVVRRDDDFVPRESSPEWLIAARRPGVGSAAATPGEARADTVHFDDLKPGTPPPGWTATRTGTGAARWTVERDDSAPSPPNVLKQSGRATYPVCLKDDASLKDGYVSVRFKAVSGRDDQAGGVVWRARDADNYYVARANALEDNLTVYHTVNGRRRERKRASVEVAAGRWHELRVDFQGSHFSVTLDGAKALEWDDETFHDAGKVGVWTKADSVTLFDDFSYGPR